MFLLLTLEKSFCDFWAVPIYVEVLSMFCLCSQLSQVIAQGDAAGSFLGAGVCAKKTL